MIEFKVRTNIWKTKQLDHENGDDDDDDDDDLFCKMNPGILILSKARRQLKSGVSLDNGEPSGPWAIPSDWCAISLRTKRRQNAFIIGQHATAVLCHVEKMECGPCSPSHPDQKSVWLMHGSNLTDAAFNSEEMMKTYHLWFPLPISFFKIAPFECVKKNQGVTTFLDSATVLVMVLETLSNHGSKLFLDLFLCGLGDFLKFLDHLSSAGAGNHRMARWQKGPGIRLSKKKVSILKQLCEKMRFQGQMMSKHYENKTEKTSGWYSNMHSWEDVTANLLQQGLFHKTSV